MSRPLPTSALIAIFVTGFVVVAGLGTYALVTPRGQTGESSLPAPEPEPPREVEVPKVTYPDGMEPSYEPTTAQVPEDGDARVVAVNLFLEGLPGVPAKARATTITVKDGVAQLDFTAEFDRTYGTTEEQALIGGLLKTLQQFPEVRSVQLTVEGRPLETLGSVELLDPLPVHR